MIIDLATVKTYLGISATTYDILISLYIPDVDAIVKDYTGLTFSDDFVCNTTNTSPIVTVQSIERTSFVNVLNPLQSSILFYRTSLKVSDYFKVGDYVTGSGLPSGATIIDIDDEDQTITLSGNCTATASGVACVKGFNRGYNRVVSQMVWYFVNTNNTSVNSDIGVKSKTIGPVTTTFADSNINAKYGLPQSLLDALPKYARCK